jgi:hypothetical protein
VIDEKGAASLHRIQGEGRIPGSPAHATKGVGVIGVGFGSDQFTVGGATPEVGATGVEEGTGEGAEGPDELAGIAAVKSGPGKLQEKSLEGLVRLRRCAGPRISGVGFQWSPFA